jgi:hypothetical protein
MGSSCESESRIVSSAHLKSSPLNFSDLAFLPEKTREQGRCGLEHDCCLTREDDGAAGKIVLEVGNAIGPCARSLFLCIQFAGRA